MPLKEKRLPSSGRQTGTLTTPCFRRGSRRHLGLSKGFRPMVPCGSDWDRRGGPGVKGGADDRRTTLTPKRPRAWRSWEKHPGPTLEGRGPRSGHRGRPHRFASQEDGCDLGAIDKRPGLDPEPHAIVLGGNVRPLRTWLNGWGLRRCPGIGLESISEINSKKIILLTVRSQ